MTFDILLRGAIVVPPTIRVLVVAAHPDDEVLGCGGAIAAHVAQGDEVHILILADGETSRNRNAGSEAVEHRCGDAQKAAEVLGARPPRFLNLPDNQLDTIPLLDIVQHVETVVGELRPQVVYTHHGNDLNIDHRIAHQAVLTACRPHPQSAVQEIYGFETPSSTEWGSPDVAPAFQPQRFVDISDFLDLKRRALACYRSEMKEFPHARSFEGCEALARWRGCSVGVPSAEAFCVLRQIVRTG